VSASTFPNDPLWQRAGEWLAPGATPDTHSDFAVIGVPAHLSSISPTGAHTTPGAVRDALMRYSTYASGAEFDLSRLSAVDLGDIEDPDGPEGEERVRLALQAIRDKQSLLVVLGGDNSITYSVMRGLAGERLGDWGLVTVDAHHDLRDGESNGSPVRRLIESGLPGQHVVQIGIADFANSAAYAERAKAYGITVFHHADLRRREMLDVAEEAMRIAGHGGRPIYVDLDVDVCDRSVAPACPASAPGGLSADELRHIAFLLARDGRVKAVDITEVDAAADAPDGRTVRLAALLVLEAAAGFAAR
jgi:formiminoglutamase